MNEELIRDEGHRSGLTRIDLEPRMSRWLDGDYAAILFEVDGQTAGYALFKSQPDYVYLRQLFVDPVFRRKGIGKAAVQWLIVNAWNDCARVRLDVLVGNDVAIQFWRSLGFKDYCMTMELEIAG